MTSLQPGVPILLAACLGGVVLPAPSARAAENPHGDVFKNRPVPAVVDFNRDVKPFLSEKCFHCHGPDPDSRKADLRLDLREDAVKPRDGSVAVNPRNPDASEIVRRVATTDPDEVMPPPKEHKPLTEREIAILRKWIAQGAPYAQHWAFVRPVKPTPPKSGPAPAAHPIDAFVAAQLAENGLNPSPEADRHTLVRRVALDLTGLPPTPEEVRSFVGDAHPAAYERMIDHFFAKPAYGERWARVWLDIARYADSAGYGSDPLRPNIWPYRDWVVNAFNRNLPYDQFTLEQMAGDLLPHATEDQLVATAFHRNTMTNTEGGTDDEEFRVAAVKDRIAVTIQAWMGLTMGCAQCHSHKFDPITQQEYYRFFAIFNQTEDSDRPDEAPTLPVPDAAQRATMEKLKTRIASLEEDLKGTPPALRRELAAWEQSLREPVPWTALEPGSAAGGAFEFARQSDGSWLVTTGAGSQATYTVKARTTLRGITAFRLEVLPDPSLPGRGPGFSQTGNFVLNELKASIAPANADAATPRARFVRVENPGPDRILSLAEVQAFSGPENLAPKGKATQSSTGFDGPPHLAIDGNTDGDYFKAKSTTHTNIEKDPWWELDLGGERAVDKLVVWNRTDGGTPQRLKGARVLLLDSGRRPLFSKVLDPAPAKNAALPTRAGETTVALYHATADHSQGGFEAPKAIDGDTKTGWAIGGGEGKPHALVVETQQPANPKGEDALLTFTLSQSFGGFHNLGRFRILATNARPPVAEIPPAVREILAVASAQRTPAQTRQLLAWFSPNSQSMAALARELQEARGTLAAIKAVQVPVLRELPADRRRETRFLLKGNFLTPADKVEPGLLASFHRAPDREPVTRLTVARWLTSRENPLTARVMVNRLWAQLFGIGLVETEEDFGSQGTLPSHPELLDWLAVDFMDRQWNVKQALKQIVMSATYRQQSRPTEEALRKDPRNLLLSHYPRRRLDAEQVRDQALALSGLLSPKTGGPSVFPPQPDGLWRAAFNGQRSWDTSKGEDRFRRGLYTFWRRTVPYPSMATFDAPSRENTTLRRLPTNTPLQAFVTLNDPAFFEMAQALAARLLREGGDSLESRIRFGLELCLARPATETQIAPLAQLWRHEADSYRARPADARQLASSPTLPANQALPKDGDPAALAAWVEVANVLLNLDGVLTKG